MFWKKNSKPKETKSIKKNELTITMKNGKIYTWAIDEWDGKIRIEPWKRFYKWFFGRTGDVFIMRYDVGETMLRRDDIMTFNIHVHTRNIDA